MRNRGIQSEFDRQFRWTRYFIRAVFILTVLIFLAMVSAGVWLVTNPSAIGEFLGQIVGGVEAGYEAAK